MKNFNFITVGLFIVLMVQAWDVSPLDKIENSKVNNDNNRFAIVQLPEFLSLGMEIDIPIDQTQERQESGQNLELIRELFQAAWDKGIKKLGVPFWIYIGTEGEPDMAVSRWKLCFAAPKDTPPLNEFKYCTVPSKTLVVGRFMEEKLKFTDWLKAFESWLPKNGFKPVGPIQQLNVKVLLGNKEVQVISLEKLVLKIAEPVCNVSPVTPNFTDLPDDFAGKKLRPLLKKNQRPQNKESTKVEKPAEKIWDRLIFVEVIKLDESK